MRPWNGCEQSHVLEWTNVFTNGELCIPAALICSSSFQGLFDQPQCCEFWRTGWGEGEDSKEEQSEFSSFQSCKGKIRQRPRLFRDVVRKSCVLGTWGGVLCAWCGGSILHPQWQARRTFNKAKEQKPQVLECSCWLLRLSGPSRALAATLS